MEPVRDQLQILARRFSLLSASCCDECCGEQVSMTQSHILFEIGRAERPSMQQVAEVLGMDVTTFSRQIKGLEGKGLVSRSRAPADRRISHLMLTDSGKNVLERIDRFMAVQLEGVFAGMSSFESETVFRSLELLSNAMARVAREGKEPKGIIACCK